jgi:hypothetical protein
MEVHHVALMGPRHTITSQVVTMSKFQDRQEANQEATAMVPCIAFFRVLLQPGSMAI